MLRSLLLLVVPLSGVLGSDPSFAAFVPPATTVPGPCPDPAPVGNFSATKFSGVWHDVQHTSRRNHSLLLQCDQLKFNALNKTKFSFSSFTHNVRTEKVISVLGTAEWTGTTGKLNVMIPSLNKKGVIRVVHTDYTTLAILWACNAAPNNTHEESTVVLTRNKPPTMSTFSAVKNILLNKKISTKHLTKTLQINCRKYDFDAKTENNSKDGGNTSLAPLLYSTISTIKPTTKAPKS